MGCECKMAHKRNVVLYRDSELVEKSKELGFNLSKTFENHLKRLVNHIDSVYAQSNSHGWWVGPDLNRRPSSRQRVPSLRSGDIHPNPPAQSSFF
ncbi:hypothetical protein E3J74_04395 [Candidatus Bathyarchaeota archaeon]|nr:MAG: hypothetical protein E3J74_04395 [Candidatus Bathyarchaeota archaeon]